MHNPLNENFWFRLFPAGDYRQQMSVRPGNAESFWSHSPEAEQILVERRHWLDTVPENHFLFVHEAEAVTLEVAAWLSSLLGRSFGSASDIACGLEPDWVILGGNPSQGFPVLGGAVVFPSGWGLEEKLGQPLAEVHDVVPGLAATLGSQITTFLSRIAQGSIWERDNWGLSAEPSLNHHPVQCRQRLQQDASLVATWLRLEQQFLMRLPDTQAILFGIRVTNHRLDTILGQHPGLAARLARALGTMPEAMAAYKGLATARSALLRQLTAIS